MCEFAYYKDNNQDMARLKCSLTNGNCPYTRVCYKVRKYVQQDNYMECPLAHEQAKNNIPVGAYYVSNSRKNKAGKIVIYVEVGGQTLKFVTDWTELNQTYVYLTKHKDGSYTPRLEKTKNAKTTN